MDYDGEQLEYLDDGAHLVLAPRIHLMGKVFCSPATKQVPADLSMDLRNKRRKLLQNAVGTTSFAPRFSPMERKLYIRKNRAGIRMCSSCHCVLVRRVV